MFKDKIIYLIRGLPGSGKSTLAKNIAGYDCFAADDFFMIDGQYKFDKNKLHEAHKSCISLVSAAMQDGKTPIAVHNTFVKAWEAKPYRDLAKKFGYSVFVITCNNNFGSIHNVPENTIKSMLANWEQEI